MSTLEAFPGVKKGRRGDDRRNEDEASPAPFAADAEWRNFLLSSED
jgi:hypothetical protein